MSIQPVSGAFAHIIRSVIGARPSAASEFRPENPILAHFNARNVTFALPMFGPWRSRFIRTVEMLTGKPRLLLLARRFLSDTGARSGPFWSRLLAFLQIEVGVDARDLARIPASGPVIMVANHAFGFIDGLVLAELMGRVRHDFKLLTRPFSGMPPEIAEQMVPVAHPQAPDVVARNVAVRKEIMDHLAKGGAVILFPAGRVATSARPFGPAVEHAWTAFTAQLILRSRATVIPVFFPGQNSRLFQIAQHYSPTLRQSLMLREILRGVGRPLHPVIGPTLDREALDGWRGRPADFIVFLRALTLSLGQPAAKTLVQATDRPID